MRTRTRRQKEILDYITEFIDSRGYEPSYQQIAKHFQINSKSAIAKHIAALEQQGLITRRRENGSFNLLVRSKVELSNDSICEIEWLDVPKNGNFYEEWENEPLMVPKFLLGYLTPNRVRAFMVPNDAMLDKQIREGDIALVEEKSFARDGEAVVAVIERNRSVLKSFFRDGAFVELRPANEDFEILRLAANKVEIRGVYRGLLRPLI
ncbi:MAG TPA: S24 family peptidase [Pyrinomonadaceae bacterium]|nr:S24 family peptidase [Pyrinomonadaceae bacterium]